VWARFSMWWSRLTTVWPWSAGLTWLIRPLALMMLIKNLGRHKSGVARKWRSQCMTCYKRQRTEGPRAEDWMRSARRLRCGGSGGDGERRKTMERYSQRRLWQPHPG
jgi:hypothetical protein